MFNFFSTANKATSQKVFQKKKKYKQTNSVWLGFNFDFSIYRNRPIPKWNVLWWCATLTMPVCVYVNIYIRYIYIHRIEIWSRFLTHETTTVCHEIPMQMSIHITYSYSHFHRVSNSVRVALLNAAPFVSFALAWIAMFRRYSVSKCSYSTHICQIPRTQKYSNISSQFYCIKGHSTMAATSNKKKYQKPFSNRKLFDKYISTVFVVVRGVILNDCLLLWVHTEKCEWTIG